MSISSSLNAGVAGLSANATKLATISDNIANSGTYGYKRAVADFESFVVKDTRGAGTYSAGGVRASTARLIEERGALVATSNALDLAVGGRGMLPVTQSVALEAQSGDLPMMMTTTGSFRTDSEGILRTESGLVLMGWPASADGEIPTLSIGTPNSSATILAPASRVPPPWHISAVEKSTDPSSLTFTMAVE